MKIGILFQDDKIDKIIWQKNQEIYYRTPRRVLEMKETLVDAGYEVVLFSSLKIFLSRIYKESVDLVFPCIECCFERNTNGFVPALLQMENIPFIGNDSYINTIASDKYLFQNIAHSIGICTPKAIPFNGQDASIVSQCVNKIGFPCILKYRYGSMSYHTSKINSSEHLKTQIEFMLSQNNGPVLCEEYIAGHELSVPVIGTAPNERILAVIEYTDSGTKPLEIYDEYWKGPNDSQVELSSLNSSRQEIRDIMYFVHKLYKYLNYKDYARFDFRLDNQGRPFLLEGNPLPALAYESAFDPSSYGKNISFKTVLSQIIENAIERYDLTSEK